ncbi:hypothetical protein [Vulcanisaeta sp. JCM 14467]|nr:hypothetical protein [Vulcanisaeta sp. JCM 14467]
MVGDYDFNHTVNELIGVAINEMKRHRFKPTIVCHLKIDNGIVIEIRSED